MVRRAVLLALLFLSACQHQVAQTGDNSDCKEEVFSDVRHIQESDDYVGTEVMLTACQSVADLSGEWREYEG